MHTSAQKGLMRHILGYRVFIGLGVVWAGIMEKKMEITIYYVGFGVQGLGLITVETRGKFHLSATEDAFCWTL